MTRLRPDWNANADGKCDPNCDPERYPDNHSESDARGDADAELREQLLGLVFVDVHRESALPELRRA